MAALAADSFVGVAFPEVGDIRVAIDTRQLAGKGDWLGPVLFEGTGPIGPEQPVVGRNEQAARAQEQRNADDEQRRQPQQVLV